MFIERFRRGLRSGKGLESLEYFFTWQSRQVLGSHILLIFRENYQFSNIARDCFSDYSMTDSNNYLIRVTKRRLIGGF